MPSALSTRIARVALDLIGAALFAAGLAILTRGMLRWSIGTYDEGIILTDAMLLLAGKAPYRDFYSNYPPGLFYVVAGLWKLFGVNALVIRYLGLAIHTAIALAAGRIAGRVALRGFSPLAAGLSMAWLSFIYDLPFAWLAALAMALIFVALLCSAADSPRRGNWVAAGAALGAVGCLRHDLFIYLCLALAVLALGWAAWNRRLRPAPELLRGGAWGALAAAVVLGALWIPTFARAGFAQVAADLYFDQVRHVLPARVLPLPLLTPMLGTPRGPALPALLGQPFEGAVALTLVGPALALLALGLRRWTTRQLPLALFLTGALSAAVMPQMLGRTDIFHALYTVTPALTLGAAIAELLALGLPRLARPPVAALLGAALALPVAFHLPAQLELRPPPASAGLPTRYGGLSDEPVLRPHRPEVLAFLQRYSQPGDPVYIGLWDHRLVFINEMDLYFLADRVGATRYMQFDPNVVNRADVQEQMIRELETVKPRVAVLAAAPLSSEPNDSTRPGAALLDAHLRERYDLVRQVGPYLLLLRR